jgi:hypothetical protein
MNEDKTKCGCGGKLRYSHFIEGKEVLSCNKYAVCLTYDEQFSRIRELNNEALRYKSALQKITDVNGMDYEYKAWAKDALN